MAANGAVSSRARPPSVPTLQHGAPAPKSRLSLMQVLGCGVLLAMGFVVVYMYRIIDSMHHEQQAMRLQLADLNGGVRGFDTSAIETRSPHLRALLTSSALWRTKAPPRPELEEVDMYYTVSTGTGETERRRLSFMATVGSGATDGCYTISDAATVTFDVSSATACGISPNQHPCPDCFITSTMSQDITLTISTCSSASWIRGQSRSGVWIYTFVNPHASRTLTITDDSGAGKTTYNVPAGTHVQAYCAASLGTSNRLYFPSYRLPTLTVDDGMMLLSGDFDASGSSTGAFTTSGGTNLLSGNVVISGTKTFSTGTGTVSLNGATTVKDNTAFTVGSAGAGGATTMYGNVIVGESSNTKTVTLHGAFDQQGTGTFSTATGVISLNGDIAVAAGKDFHMTSGVGTFTTGTGDVTLNGNTVISGTKTFTTGGGTVSLMGDTTVDTGHTFTVGTSASGGGDSTLYGNLIIGANSAGGSKGVTLYGDFSQLDGADGAQTFSTATGAITLNGDTTVTANNNLHMTASSTGTFQTGAGAVTLNGNTLISGTNTFITGQGAVSLKGTTTIADDKAFNVGSPGAGGDAQFFGNVLIGGSSNAESKSLEVYGAVTFRDDADGTAKTFDARNTGQSTFYGNVFIEQDKNFEMHSPGQGLFKTATGPVTLRGDTTVDASKTFTIASQGNGVTCTTSATHSNVAKYCVAN